MSTIKPQYIPAPSVPNGQSDSHESINARGNNFPVKMQLFDLPVELILDIADYLPPYRKACLALTCGRARDIFKKRIGELSRRQRQQFLLVLQKELPAKIICQHHLRLVNFCRDPRVDPSHPRSIMQLSTAFLFTLERCNITACVPVPSINAPKFLLSYEHIQRVMLRHHYGPGYGKSLYSLSHDSQISFDGAFQGTTCAISIRFCILENQLYMHGSYDFSGVHLMRLLAFSRHHFDICPHLYLDHNRRPYIGGQRRAVRLPNSLCRVFDDVCYCTVNGSFDPRWRLLVRAPRGNKSNKNACSSYYVAPPTPCRHCATDLKMRFVDTSGAGVLRQRLEVHFWRCLGAGAIEELDIAWRIGSLNEKTRSGDVVEWIPGATLRWLRGEDSAGRFGRGATESWDLPGAPERERVSE
ncbi:uncharacterized protein IWZ02DRAFT_11898 [Phyllosticta citriasiana]|uniref:uncharacterized protein n=1 Tax=Phyllosticta citriasiana TaxID=595635 RepID=UPI0030FDF4E1